MDIPTKHRIGELDFSDGLIKGPVVQNIGRMEFEDGLRNRVL